MFAMILGVLSSLATEKYKRANLQSQDITKLNRYLKWRQAPADLKNTIMRYIRFVREGRGEPIRRQRCAS